MLNLLPSTRRSLLIWSKWVFLTLNRAARKLWPRKPAFWSSEKNILSTIFVKTLLNEGGVGNSFHCNGRFQPPKEGFLQTKKKRKKKERKRNLQSIPTLNFPHKTCHFALPSATATIITLCLLLIASTAEAQRGALAQSQAFIRGSICCMALVHTQKNYQQRQKEAESQVPCNPSASPLTAQP